MPQVLSPAHTPMSSSHVTLCLMASLPFPIFISHVCSSQRWGGRGRALLEKIWR